MTAPAFQIAPNTLGGSYPVQLPLFQGPLDLLLQLIERQELDITEISLVAVTDQYLSAIEELETVAPGALAEFLVVAAKLLYIKSRRLLPQPQSSEDDEAQAGQDLLQQLLEYRRFKRVAAALQRREEAGLRAFLRTAPPPHMERTLDLSNISSGSLARALHKALERLPSEPDPPRVKTVTISIAEQASAIRARLWHALQRGQPAVPFQAVLSKAHSRTEVIVTFLAVLELIKQREVQASQQRAFGEILLALRTDADAAAGTEVFSNENNNGSPGATTAP